MCRDWRVLLVIVLCLSAAARTYLSAEDTASCACGTTKVSTTLEAPEILSDVVYCTLRVTGTLCDGTIVDRTFVGEGDNSTGIPDFAAAWSDAEMQEMMWEMEACDSLMVPACGTTPCSLTRTHENCVPPQPPFKLAAVLGNQWYECVRTCRSKNENKKFSVSAVSRDAAQAQQISLARLETMTQPYGGIDIDTLETTTPPTREVNCVARVKAVKGNDIFDYELHGTGLDEAQATLELEARIAGFKLEFGLPTVQPYVVKCRMVPTRTKLVGATLVCETNNQDKVLHVRRLATHKVVARSIAKAVMEVRSDQFGGIKSCQ